MGLDSYLELFTTMYGWGFARIIWDILRDTGIIFIPLLVTIVSTWMQAHEMGQELNGATWMIRKMEIEVGVAIFVLAFCAVPNSVTSLSHTGLYYSPTSTTLDPSPTTANGASPQSTYGSAFSDVPGTADIPAWWYTVMSLSSGVNAAIKAGVNSGIRDFRQFESLANMAAVEDPQLRHEIQRFYSECFVPARSRYLTSGSPSPTAASAITTYGEADIDWIGSHTFRNDPNLYGALYAETGVPGFALDPIQDADMNGNPITPTYGRPTCKGWWEDPTQGLRNKMVEGVGKADWLLNTKLGDLFPSISQDDRDDQMAKLALRKSKPSYVDSDKIVGNERGAMDEVLRFVPDALGHIGILGQGWEASTTLYALVQFLTMAQPLILMGIYMFLPLVLVFSRYSLQVMFVGAIAIFTVKFWAVMWFIARWLDDHLLEAMYPGANGTALMEAITSWDGSIKRTTLNILLMAMYVGFPLIWSSMMMWVGIKVGVGLQNIQDHATSPALKAGQLGASLGKSATRLVFKR